MRTFRLFVEVLLEGKTESSLDERFRKFREQTLGFSQEIVSDFHLPRDPLRAAELNLSLSRAVFGKWSIEILVTLYTLHPVRFEELKKVLSPISPRVLSVKLKTMETLGLVERTIVDSRPPSTRDALTEKGMTVATFGEPVILYLRWKEGSLLEGPRYEGPEF